MFHTLPNKRIAFKKPFTIIYFLLASSMVIAQKAPEKNWSSSRIMHELEKLNHVGRVLYIAAHPDDENTQLISYLANVKGIDVAYMSLTRGDGGQDLLGPEVGEELGVIRTQELLMARSIDGGQQFFSRANDFGFSKTAEETLHIWDSTEVLSDIVWVIRKFKPDIIITRFSPTYKKTHGHHQASAILAQAAFDDAANPGKFPEQLQYVGTWQAKSLFWNTSYFFFQGKDNKFDTTGLYHTNTGVYMPLLGEWTGEMAAESRSMHKSQGMGATLRRGDNMEYFVYMKGEKPAGRDIFNDYDWGWDRIEQQKYIEQSLQSAEDQLSHYITNPAHALAYIQTLYNELSEYSDNYLVQSKIKELQEIILQCEGVYTEAISTGKFLVPGDSIKVDLSSISPNGPVNINASLMVDGKEVAKSDIPVELIPNANKTISLKGIIPQDATITGPYWLEEQPTVGMYKVANQLLRGLPQNPPQVSVHITYSIGELVEPSSVANSHQPIVFEQDIPVFYKYIDPIKGETYSVVKIVPPAVAIPDTKLLVFGSNKPQELNVKVKSFQKGKASLSLSVPPGWRLTIDAADTSRINKRKRNISSLTQTMDMNGEGQEQTFTYYVWPTGAAETNSINITIAIGNKTYNRSMEDINYNHIPEQIILPRSEVKLVKVDINTHPKLVGYIEGAGDDIPQMLREIGYSVEIIPADQLATADLSKYDAIIAGIRAYNTVSRLKYDNIRLMDYVMNGGNYIVQYNNNFRLVTDSIGPYYIHPSNIRTTDENCKVTLLNTDNPALNTPNKITEKDFDGWVQERGLYYPDKWDTAHYVPLLEMNDPGEQPVKGALLVAPYGKGNFVYTGLVFFRELPAGVPGAYRLLANLIELEKH